MHYLSTQDRQNTALIGIHSDKFINFMLNWSLTNSINKLIEVQCSDSVCLQKLSAPLLCNLPMTNYTNGWKLKHKNNRYFI